MSSQNLAVLYEDDHLIAVNKPAGMVVHPAYKNPDGTLLDALRSRAGAWLGDERPSIVGRLDKLTSGVVLVAKTAGAHAALQRATAAADAEKDYLAVVYGRPDRDAGEIALPLALNPSDRRVVVVAPETGAVSATRFELAAEIDAPAVGLSLLRCRLVTGRRHQIRVHLSASGWPIVGDPIYGPPRWADICDEPLRETVRRFDRQALHAHRLAFVHPATRRRVEIAAPIPADMLALLDAAGLSG